MTTYDTKELVVVTLLNALVSVTRWFGLSHIHILYLMIGIGVVLFYRLGHPSQSPHVTRGTRQWMCLFILAWASAVTGHFNWPAYTYMVCLTFMLGELVVYLFIYLMWEFHHIGLPSLRRRLARELGVPGF